MSNIEAPSGDENTVYLDDDGYENFEMLWLKQLQAKAQEESRDVLRGLGDD